MPAELLLRRGLVDDVGDRHRRVALRPLAGRDEARLADRDDALVAQSDEDAVHEVLATCVERLGGYRDVTPVHVAALSRGDRQRLALALRALMIGDQLVLTLRCPRPDCGELADLELRVSALLDEGSTDAPAEPEWWTVDTPAGKLRLRTPTGADDEALAALAGSPAERAAAFWNRLIDADWAALDTTSRQLLARTLAGSGSLPDLTFASPCPACRALLELELNPFDLLVRELALGTDRLLAEVHCLAFHYGWSEDAILGLPRARRWRYLELLRQQLDGRPLV
ncbi:hypothetical protein [Cryptosporangium minutisporangium]|uniref:Uncharacterized protein n=1 Tax=Cryptosporangium minutisporangium TaxID=113569 RepID=A0ABP6T1P9_9ACTN